MVLRSKVVVRGGLFYNNKGKYCFLLLLRFRHAMAYMEKLREGTLAGAIDKCVHSLMHYYNACM